MASTVVGSSPGPPAEIWWTRTRGASGTGSTGGGRLTGVSPTGAGAATAGAGRADGGAPQPAPAILEATAAPTAGSGAGAARPFAAAAPTSAAPLWTGPGLYVVCICVGAAPPAPPTITGLILRRPSAPRVSSCVAAAGAIRFRRLGVVTTPRPASCCGDRSCGGGGASAGFGLGPASPSSCTRPRSSAMTPPPSPIASP